MKKIVLACSLVLLAFLLNSHAALAGKPFEGVITYKITYPDSKFSESQMAMFPKVLTVSIKGAKSRTDMQMSGMNSVEITDYTEKTSVSLINMMGQKYAIKMNPAEIESKMNEDGTAAVELSEETKVIAGYTCKKATVTMNKDGVKTVFEAFYTSELGSKMVNFNNPIYKDIDGVLLEFSMQNQQINMKFSASSVEKKSIASKEFDIPSDYKITTQEELKNLFGGGNE